MTKLPGIGVKKKKHFKVEVKLVARYYKIIIVYIKMAQRQRRHVQDEINTQRVICNSIQFIWIQQSVH